MQAIPADANLLDDSWRLELPARLGAGELSGRDFVATYGPFRQLLQGLGWLVPPGDLASVIRFAGIGEAAVGVLSLWTLLVLTGAPFGWRAAALLVWAAFLPSDVKPLAGLAAVSLLVAGLGEGTSRRRRLFAWAASVPILTLYSFDLGLLSLAALLVSAGAVAAAVRLRRNPERDAVSGRALFGALAAFAGFAAFASLLHTLPGWRGYLPDSLEMARGYAERQARGLSTLGALQLLAAALAGFVAAGRGDSRLAVAAGMPGALRRPFALLSAGLFAAIWTRYGMTRSDDLHLYAACVPAVLVACVLLPCHLRADGGPRAGALLAGGLAAAAAVGSTAPAEALAKGGPPAPLVLAGGRIRVEQAPLARALARLPAGAKGDLFVWPYETLVNVLTGRRNPVPTLQIYSANTDALERRVVEGLVVRPEMPALLFTRSWAIDDVEPVTRSPLVFRHLLDRYELDGPPAGGIALLRPASTGAPRWAEEKLAVAPASYAPGGDRFAQIALPDDCCRANDFLVVRLRAARTPTFGLFKPGRVFAGFRFDRGAPRGQPLALPQDGEAHTVLLSAVTVPEPLFLSAFAPQGVRAGERLLGIAFKWLPLDFLSLAPAELTVESVSILRRQGETLGEVPSASTPGSR